MKSTKLKSALTNLFAATLKPADCSTLGLRVALVLLWLAPGLVLGGEPEIVWSTNAHTYVIERLAFSADGALLISGSWDRTAKVWRVSDRSLVRAFSMRGVVLAAAISPDRTIVALADDAGVYGVWRIADGTSLWRAIGSDNRYIDAASFSPDNTAVAWAIPGEIVAGIKVTDSQTGRSLPFENPLDRYGDDRAVFDVRFSPHGALLASGNADNTASLFRMPEGTLIRDLAGHSRRVMSVDFSPDGTLLATSAGDGTARLWNVTNGAVVRVIEGGGGTGLPTAGNGGVGWIRFSADGKTVLTSSNGTLRFWRVSDGRLLLTYTNIGDGVFAVSPDGKHFAYGGRYLTNYVVALARWPLLITTVALRTNALHLDWQGGSGRYQVQQTSNVVQGPWVNLGPPTTNTSLSLPLDRSAPARFFRIRSLPEGP